MAISSKSQKIFQWQESIARLPDQLFYEILRMYLGEIKTPFNKQRLVEQLCSFVGNEAHSTVILKLLDKSDLELLSAVYFLNNPTILKLNSLFKSKYYYATLYEKILNLEERLLIYKESSDKNSRLLLNPMLEEKLIPLLSISYLFPEAFDNDGDFNDELNVAPSETNFTPGFLAAFLCYLKNSDNILKNDGELKKKAVTDLAEIFGFHIEDKNEILKFEYLIKSFCNLGIIVQNQKGNSLNFQKLKSLFNLDFETVCAYLCVAAAGHFLPKTIQENAELFLDTIKNIPDSGLSLQNIHRLSLVVKEKKSEAENFSARGISRFASLLQAARENENPEPVQFDAVEIGIQCAVVLGLLQQVKNSTGTKKFIWNCQSFELADESKKVLNMDSGFEVTMMPGLNLAELFEVTKPMEIVRYDNAATYLISRKSANICFARGISAEQIQSLLSKYSYYELPQSLVVSLEDWYSNYNSASLYKGYVLKLNKEKQLIAENNPSFTRHIIETLAPGIYLVDFENDDEAKSILQKCSLDCSGNIRQNFASDLPGNFGKIYGVSGLVEIPLEQPECIYDDSIICKLKDDLKKMNLSVEQNEGLLERIEKKVVLSKDQLVPASVHFEKIEATGMDYIGKIHVAENAISSGNLVEIDVSGVKGLIVAKPVAIINKTDNARLKILTVPDESELELPIARFRRIKKLRK